MACMATLGAKILWHAGQRPFYLSNASAKTESENNRPALQETVAELHPAAR